ncbi:MAG: hypothetical protein H6Q59_1564 [Firmicutes bacterium]|nr:hypothetical protein [Bacillota bacterium]
MKRIVLFTGGVETLDFFSLQLGQALEQIGHEVMIFDLLNEEQSYYDLISFSITDQTVMICFNFTGICGEEIFQDEEGNLFWDIHRIPCYNIIVDHPFYYHEHLRRRPRYYHQFCIDRDHVSYMQRYFPEIRLEGFLPSAGTILESNGCYLPLKERKMDIIFAGNYSPPETFDKHITRIDEEYTYFYRSIIDALITDPCMTMESTFEHFLTKEMGELTVEELKLCMENMIFIDLYVRFYFRGQVIRTLVDAGFQVHVFGKGWQQLKCLHPENLFVGGSMDSFGCLQQISQAKISLNVMPWFKDGAHDRIFNSMLNGALCLSDESRYLREELRDGVELQFFSLTELEKLPELVASLLNHPDKMEDIIEAGYRKAAEGHTWAHRAKVLSQRIEQQEPTLII